MIFPDDLVSFGEVEEVVREAGKLLLRYYEDKLTKNYKSDGSYATEADLAAEEFLIAQLTELLPEAGIFAEESGKNDHSGRYNWVIDPLDGTNNFAHSIPYSCISIALVEDDHPILAIIYDFHRNELFAAYRDHGAFLNGRPISVSKTDSMEQALICAPVAYKGTISAQKRQYYWNCLERVEKQCVTIRVLGAAALDLAYVAAGRVDGVFFEGLSWWDVAAGILLISEAGGQVSTYDQGVITSSFSNLVGGNKRIYPVLVGILEKSS